ncbi:hypothetical protein [Prosthecochloris ethylica]|uniref:hypothetical protein n=1 Tax=Prosthecochloris ethylica TaxID=2743976 RepID=UPI001F5B3A70|nr:hypothetical protein [Prosthecochloris ethylica]
MRCFEEDAKKGSTGFMHEQYGFIDKPVYRGALAVLAATGQEMVSGTKCDALLNISPETGNMDQGT